MKTNVKLLSVIALLASACTTGSMVTSGSYGDDAYFTPGDHQPVITSTTTMREQPKRNSTTISGIRQEEAGKIVDNYFSDKKEGNSQSDAYTLNGEQANSDTTYVADQEAQDFISNYDEPEDIDYTTRIRTFYDPYAYDPYWDSSYYPGFGFGWGLGFSGLYSGFGFGYGGYYGGWGYPYMGWGGYYGGYWGNGYGGYGGHGGWGNGYNHRNYADNNQNRYYGRQNSNGQGGSNTLGYSSSGRGALSSSYLSNHSISRSFVNTSRGSRAVNTGIVTGATRQGGTRYTVNPNQTRSANLNSAGRSGAVSNPQTITNLRRGQVSGQNSQNLKSATTPGGAVRYTPTYSRPRTNIQATYNTGAARQYSRPQSYSGSTNSGRSAVSGSYQSGSSRAPKVISSGASRSSGQSAVRSNSSSGSYSAPSRSSSSGSSGGGSSRSFSSGGGGGGGGGRRH